MAINDGIDTEDGTVDDPYQGIETYYCPLEGISEVDDPDGNFFRITGDNDGTNVEIRVPVAVLEQNGWARTPRP
jgi:hypothetical protein